MAEITKMLREDHKKVKQLFDRFESTQDSEEQKNIADTALLELEVHSAIEHQLVYPALEEELEDEEMLNEAYEEHHVVEFLIDDVAAATNELRAAGVPIVSGPVYWEGEDDVAWVHFRAPDGNIYGITQGRDLEPES